MIDREHSNGAGKQSKSRHQNMWEYVVEYDSRPTNLELMAGNYGLGCFVSEFGKNTSGMIYEGSRLVAINDHAVENQKYDNIMMRLKTATYPLRLLLHSPNIKADQRGEPSKRRKRHSHRSKSKPTNELEPMKSKSSNLTSRSSKQKRKSNKSNHERRGSTGSWHLLTEQRPIPKKHGYLPKSSKNVQAKVPSKQRKTSTTEMKEELFYLRSSLKRIYTVLTSPRSDGFKKEEEIEFNRKFVKHFQMMQMILATARANMAKEPAFFSPRLSYREAPGVDDHALGWNINQWLERIIQELGVDRLKLNSRAEECAMSFQAISSLKETKNMLSNQVQSLEQMIKFVRKKKAAIVAQMEAFKSKIVDVGQKIDNVVVKVLGLRDRLGSLVKCLTMVQHPGVARVVSDVRLEQIHERYASTTSLESSSPLVEQLVTLTSTFDQMISLIRKSEVVIHKGLVSKPEGDADLTETGAERFPCISNDFSNQSYASVPNLDKKPTFLE